MGRLCCVTDECSRRELIRKRRGNVPVPGSEAREDPGSGSTQYLEQAGKRDPTFAKPTLPPLGRAHSGTPSFAQRGVVPWSCGSCPVWAAWQREAPAPVSGSWSTSAPAACCHYGGTGQLRSCRSLKEPPDGDRLPRNTSHPASQPVPSVDLRAAALCIPFPRQGI